MEATEELVYEMVFDWSKKNFDNFNNTLKTSIAGFAKLTGAVTVAQGIAFAFAKSIADTNDQLAKQSTRLNILSSDYQKLSFGAKDFGAETQDVTTSLRALRKAQEDILLGKGDVAAFGELGINPTQFSNTNDLFLALADSISQIEDRGRKLNLLDRIGVSENLLQLLDSGSENIKNLGKELETLGAIRSPDQLQVANDFQAVWLRTSTIIDGISSLVGTELTKNYNKALTEVNKFFLKNAESITEGFNKFFEVVNDVSSQVFFILSRVAGVLKDIFVFLKNNEIATHALAGAFVFLQRKMIMAFAIPIGLATGLFLLVEDIITLFKGGDSAIGNFLGIDSQTIQTVKDYFSELNNSYNTFIDNVRKKGIWEAIKIDLQTFGNELTNIFEPIMKWFEMLFEKIQAFKDSLDFSGAFANGIESISNAIGISSPQVPQEQSITNNNSNPNININVNGADGNVVDQIETYFQTKFNSFF